MRCGVGSRPHIVSALLRSMKRLKGLIIQRLLDPLQLGFQLIELGRVVALRFCRHSGILREIGLKLG